MKPSRIMVNIGDKLKVYGEQMKRFKASMRKIMYPES